MDVKYGSTYIFNNAIYSGTNRYNGNLSQRNFPPGNTINI